MATPAVPTPASPPPAPPASAHPAPAPILGGGGPPRRLMPLRPLAPSQIGLLEHLTRWHVATVPAGTPMEHITGSEFWQNVSDRLRPADRVDVHFADGSRYVELYIRQASRPTPGVKGSVLVAVLRDIEFEPLDTRPKMTTYKVEFLGPAQGWSIVRVADGRVFVENIEDRATAEKRASAMNIAAPPS